MTNVERLIEYLKKNKTITSLEAINLLGDTRLSGTIWKLKKAGYNIETETIVVKNRWGKKVPVAKYELKEEE